MSRQAPGMTLCTMLALGIWLVAATSVRAYDEDDDKQIKAAQKDVLELVQTLEKGGKIDEARVKAIKKKYEELNHIMQIYKPSTRKGLSVFKPKGPNDGIEVKLGKLASARSPMKPDVIKKMEAELIKAGHGKRAMSPLTKEYAPAKTAQC